MATPDVSNQYYTLESRLASFKVSTAKPKRRSSVASKNQKTGRGGGWPHDFLSPQALAEAGFYHAPKRDLDDNVKCFLCAKNIDGWEEGDDALLEHLKHSSDCGWAIVSALQAGHEELRTEDPMGERMMEARMATFGDLWPHDSKRGWVSKSKQMAAAGWKYTPTEESEDLATCAYCALGLDGWEPKDKAMIEHRKRSPDCTFFKLVDEHKKAATKPKSVRSSKASRLSTQSNLTSMSEAPSFVDEVAEDDDSIMTSATNATSRTGTKKGKGTKANTAKTRKTRARKQEPEEVVAAEPEVDGDEVNINEPDVNRVKKRTSDQIDEDSTAAVEQQPPAKRRIARTRASMAIEDKTTTSVPEKLAEEPATDMSTALRKRGRPSRGTRKISTASIAAELEHTPNDDEIDRALAADLERPLTDDEDRPSERENSVSNIRRVSRATEEVSSTAKPVTGKTRSIVVSSLNRSMFDSEPMEIDDSSIEKELVEMETEEVSKLLPQTKVTETEPARKPSAKQQAAARRAEKAAEATAAAEADAMMLDAQNDEPLQSPEPAPKARKAGNRHPRKVQARSTRASSALVNAAAVPQEDAAVQFDQDNHSGNDTDVSMASQATVIKGGKTRRGSALKKGRGGKKAASRHIEDIIHKDVGVVPGAKKSGKPHNGKEVMIQNIDGDEGTAIFEDAVDSEAERADLLCKAESKNDKGKGKVLQELSIVPAPYAATPSSLSMPFSPKLVASARKSPQPPSSPGGPQEPHASPSPQSSDAENHPPSSRPSAVRHSLNLQETAVTRHTVLVPLASTPTGSPSKRNIINGLQTSQQWTPLDLDKMFARSPAKDSDVENRDPGHRAFNEILERARTGAVTSHEQNMTIEEWIVDNAEIAAGKLREDCERMVGVFEEAGQRAMRSVEGIECHDDE